ncbi:hypothetical protein [Stappia indica]|uniref:hypothetical protein n=1 Tax=Stappia indica TaxID=538381 RepID=UPI0008370C1A|nr:hypothetical protein [Stappia indica]
MIGLIVMRGYPHSVVNDEAFKHPVGLFQKRQIERHMAAKGETVKAWVTLGEDASRPIRQTNPAFIWAFGLAGEHECGIALDNVFRLYDGATKDSAEALTSFFIQRKLFLYSVAHQSAVRPNSQLFQLLLADRLNAIAQVEELPRLKGELKLKGFSRPPKLEASARNARRQKNSEISHIPLLSAIIRCARNTAAGGERITIADLCTALNEEGTLTETGVLWTTANLRKKLRRMREHFPRSRAWDLIAL